MLEDHLSQQVFNKMQVGLSASLFLVVMSLLWKVVISLNASFFEPPALPFLFSPLPHSFHLRLMLKSIKPEGSLSYQTCFSPRALLLMLILWAPFLPWQQEAVTEQLGHFSKPWHFTSSAQWKHLQICSKIHTHWVYMYRWKYSDLVVEFSALYPV